MHELEIYHNCRRSNSSRLEAKNLYKPSLLLKVLEHKKLAVIILLERTRDIFESIFTFLFRITTEFRTFKENHLSCPYLIKLSRNFLQNI